MEKVQYKMSATLKKRCIMKRVQEKCRIRKTGNMKKVQHTMSATKSNTTKGAR